MSHLAAADLARLSKMLELALRATTPEAERLAATAKATALLDQHQMRWGDVQRQLQAEPVHRAPMLGTWRAVCARLLERQDALNRWEVGFVNDLPRFRRLSVKQRYCLVEIAKRVLGEDATYRE